MTMIIDGMDQAKTNIPNTKVIAKSTSGLWHLWTHITGCLQHTQSPHGKLPFVYVDMLQWPHDSNLTVTTIMNVLTEADKIRPLPESLYIQLDNTARENKNKYVLGFCAFLIEKKVFKKVHKVHCKCVGTSWCNICYFFRLNSISFLLVIHMRMLTNSSARFQLKSDAMAVNHYQVL